MSVRKAFIDFYWKAHRTITPTLRYSQEIYEEVLFFHSERIDSWLDLGCGHHLLPTWRLEQERILVEKPRFFVGMDCDISSLRNHKTIKNLVLGDISLLPFSSNSFDLITSNMVFEHLADPENQLKEIFRILKPGGLLIFHTPNASSYLVPLARLFPDSLKTRLIWFFNRRREDDIFPTHYRINKEKTILKMAETTGFGVKKIRFIASVGEFAQIPPLAILELLLIRLTMTRFMRKFRTNIIVVLVKPSIEDRSDVEN